MEVCTILVHLRIFRHFLLRTQTRAQQGSQGRKGALMLRTKI
jgi:hypothetical protein